MAYFVIFVLTLAAEAVIVLVKRPKFNSPSSKKLRFVGEAKPLRNV